MVAIRSLRDGLRMIWGRFTGVGIVHAAQRRTPEDVILNAAATRYQHQRRELLGRLSSKRELLLLLANRIDYAH